MADEDNADEGEDREKKREEDAEEPEAAADDSAEEEEEDSQGDEEEESEDEESDEEESDEEESDEEESEDEESEDEESDEQKAVGETERAAGVAKALGVGDEAETPEAADQKVLNRAERRRQRAMRRRGKREEDEAAADKGGDRNVKKRDELLRRRRRVAAAADEDVPPDRLLASEMVDDALARAGAAVVKWTKRNVRVLGWAAVVAIVGTGGFFYYRHRTEKGTMGASDALAEAVAADGAIVVPKEEDDRTEEQKKSDFRRIFYTDEEREKAALEAYKRVTSEYGGTGAAILARLGEAGVLLDERKWDEAIAAFNEVLESPLAAADPDVRARALEGKAFAQEGKEQPDDALATFEKLADVPGDGYKLLSHYHQARVLARKDKKKATELLKAARQELQKTQIDSVRVGGVGAYRWLEHSIEEELRALDPAAVPKAPPHGGELPPDLQEKLKQLTEGKGP